MKRFKGFILCLALTFSIPFAALSQGVNSYFPPTDSQDWEKVPLNSLGWDNASLAELLSWLPTQGTRSFMIVKDGKIAVEEYWGAKLTGMGNMDEEAMWYWDDAGRTLTAALVGIAEKNGFLKIKDRTSKYLGEAWSSVPEKREKEIRILNQLSMSTGLDERIEDPRDTSTEALKFFAKAGERWAYHDAPYTLLMNTLENATNQSISAFFKERLATQIGMKGFWQETGGDLVFFSDARSMSKFGLLLMNEGEWEGNQILDKKYVQAMTSSSQQDNPGYGFLTWLNSGDVFKLPGNQVPNKGKMIAAAPEDMFMALGKNGQLLMVIPSQGLVIVRQGTYSNDSIVPQRLLQDLWQKLNRVIN
ncbi:serine hydrolase domain-containing protein [Algoriphagus namhaensis]|uniref:Serine hydrolase domain-containing protein n=1 Tax=Algoriphagus namhaensis TaxID=915353 RepID=A0ABV8ARX7_9BACT